MDSLTDTDSAHIARLYEPSRPERVMTVNETVDFLRAKVAYARAHPELFVERWQRFGEAAGWGIEYPGDITVGVVCDKLQELSPGLNGLRVFLHYVFGLTDLAERWNVGVSETYQEGYALAQWAPLQPDGNHWALPAYIVQEYLAVVEATPDEARRRVKQILRQSEDESAAKSKKRAQGDIGWLRSNILNNKRIGDMPWQHLVYLGELSARARVHINECSRCQAKKPCPARQLFLDEIADTAAAVRGDWS